MALAKINKYKVGKGKKAPEATHVPGKKHHLVGLKNIRVIIVRDEGSWFAQGLDIDYAAQGESIEQAKKNFSGGLAATIDQHLQAYGTFVNFLKPTARQDC